MYANKLQVVVTGEWAVLSLCTQAQSNGDIFSKQTQTL